MRAGRGPHWTACPRCDATPGIYCIDPKTKKPRMGYHRARWNAYEHERKRRT